MHRVLASFTFIALLLALMGHVATAQTTTDPVSPEESGKLSLTLTPPLFQIGLAREGAWQTTLKLVNANPYPITVYAQVVNFQPEGETGNASFSPFAVQEKPGPYSLAGWVNVPSYPIPVKAGETADIPFSIRVPADASPGGHYAAILIGTQPPQLGKEVSGTAVGSMLASLLFVRVPGDVIEKGDIRDFYAGEGVVQKPIMTFSLRFQNSGNVHILPRGEIIIKNMWGKERGKIALSDGADFGNILPSSTRKFTFEWKGEESIFEAGRYTAEATLQYGEEGKQTVYRVTSFWVIPFKELSVVLIGVIALVWFVGRMIRRYISRALALERERLGLPATPVVRQQIARSVQPAPVRPPEQHHVPPPLTLSTLTLPIKATREEIRRERSQVAMLPREGAVPRKADTSTLHYVKRYKLFFITLLLIVLGIVAIGWYFIEVFREERAFLIEVKKEGAGGMMVMKE